MLKDKLGKRPSLRSWQWENRRKRRDRLQRKLPKKSSSEFNKQRTLRRLDSRPSRSWSRGSPMTSSRSCPANWAKIDHWSKKKSLRSSRLKQNLLPSSWPSRSSNTVNCMRRKSLKILKLPSLSKSRLSKKVMEQKVPRLKNSRKLKMPRESAQTSRKRSRRSSRFTRLNSRSLLTQSKKRPTMLQRWLRLTPRERPKKKLPKLKLWRARQMLRKPSRNNPTKSRIKPR